ncbi:MAG TPA: hypothetical protein GX503_06035 [Clostridiales bacterium]|nr:hypothetical protein [Clostridiales bacterium]
MTVKKAILFSLIGLVLGVLVFGGIFFFTAFHKPVADKKEEKIYTYSIGELYANVNESRRILKANIAVETKDEKIHEELDKNKSKIINNILELVRSKTEADLSGDTGQQQLRKEVLGIIHSIIPGETITNVYFVEFIIQ